MKGGLGERSIAYSLRVIKLYRVLAKDAVGRVLGDQLLRAATSVGANIHEAEGAQSRVDFIAKVSIAHKEAREAAYWIRLIREAQLVPEARLADLVGEADQMIKILSSSLLTAKQKKDPQ